MSTPILFVSLGPGEPELITLKGLKALQAADCIFCPETHTAGGRTFSRAADIMHALNISDRAISRFALPMSKNREQAFAAYDKVYEEAAQLYREDKEAKTSVVIMKLSQCTEEVHRCIRCHPEYEYHYFENVGTSKEICMNDASLIGKRAFPYFSLLIIKAAKQAL